MDRDTFLALAPVLGVDHKMALSSSTVHGGHHDTKYVTFELLLRAAFVADENWGDMLEAARILPVIDLPTSSTITDMPGAAGGRQPAAAKTGCIEVLFYC